MNKKILFLFICTFLSAPFLSQADVMLQYFESRWETIERRAVDVFLSGYSSVWLPPNAVADSGGWSVGYDPFDRFNFGSPEWQTLYGTKDSYEMMVDELQKAGIRVYQDVILNHNGFRDHRTPGFEEEGGYPGFATSLPDDEYGDFHPPDAQDEWEERIEGLISIAHDKNHQYIRHPVEEDEDNLPYEDPDSDNRRLYFDPSPDPEDETTPSGFNLSNPEGGEPFKENATGLLLRYMRWMNEVIEVDGFRLDAVKHIPTWFFDDFYDDALHQKGRRDLEGEHTTPFSFGEAYTGDFNHLAQYIQKDETAHRDVLDFPLFFTLEDIFNAGGYGDLRELSTASIDGLDGNYHNGTYGVQFAGSHDDQAPSADNPAHAYILTRPGYPLVYFNAFEFGEDRDFPEPGRGDALGGRYGDRITRLVQIHNEYARGEMKIRREAEDIYIYERSSNLLVGISDREDEGYQQATVDVDFPPETELRELTGNHDQSEEIAEYLTVNSNQQVSLRVPHNNLQQGYVMYGPDNPKGELSIEPVSDIMKADSEDRTLAKQRLADIPVVTEDTITLTLQTTEDIPEDNAIFRLNRGENITGEMFMSGEFPGFEPFDTRNPRHEGGNGLYKQEIDVSNLEEGYHYIQVAAFINRPVDYPPVFTDFRKAFYLDREGVAMEVLYPPLKDGMHTIESEEYVLRFKNPCGTGNSFHIFFDDEARSTNVEDYLDEVDEENRMTQYDRRHWEYHWHNIPEGERTVAVVGFEESGRAELHRWENFYSGEPDSIIASLSAEPIEGVAPLTVDFNDDSLGEIDTWQWNFGDGSTSSKQNPVHEYTEPGHYSVSLKVTGPAGSDQKTEEELITVLEPAYADFEVNVTSTNPGEEIIFTDLSTGYITEWLWDFGDGTASSDRHPSHFYEEPGVYTISLTAANPYQSDSMTEENHILVYQEGTPEFDAELVEWEISPQIPVDKTTEMLLTFRNSGREKWSKEKNVYLGAVNDYDALAASQFWRTGSEEPVYHLQETTFTIPLHPEETGIFQTEWQMLKETNAWFGEVFSKEIEVHPRTDIPCSIWRHFDKDSE